MNRRNFLSGLGVLSATGLVFRPMEPLLAAPAIIELPSLPYAYNALEPHIDARTMEVHHSKHHAAYINNLNAALAKYPQLQGKTIETLLQSLEKLPKEIRTTIRNNGGGHVNHSQFWQTMSPQGGGQPSGKLAEAIVQTFGSFAAFQTAFETAGMQRFGSGWVWLVQDKAGKLKIISTPNQDSPLTLGETPILGNDLWEHAYYLSYQNRRADYLKAWWNVVNWSAVATRYQG